MSDIAFSVDVDQRSIDSWVSALEAYADVRQNKGWDYCVNRAAKNVCFKAAQVTKHADKEALATLLGDEKVAAKILSARFTKAGKKRPGKQEWIAALKYFRTHTLKTVNFMRSGWLPAARMFASLVKESVGVDQRTAFGRTDPDIPTGRLSFGGGYASIGDGVTAHETNEGIEAEMMNRSINPRNSTSAGALANFGASGLSFALADRANDMMEYVREEHEKRAKEHNK